MKFGITAIFLFALLVYNGKLSSGIFVTKVDFWDHIDTSKKNTSTFSLQCQNQMVKVESNIYNLDRLRSSLKSDYFMNIFTSDDFKQKNYPVLEIQPLNSEVFPTIVDLIHGEGLWNALVLNKDKYVSLLEAMDYLNMCIDLETVKSFIDVDLKSDSLEEAKIFELYNFIGENSKFEYLLNSVFKHFANDLTTVQNQTLFLSLSLDRLIRLIENVQASNYEKRYQIVQMCTKWLCHDMKNRLPHMAKLMTCAQSVFYLHTLSEEMNSDFTKCLSRCNVNAPANETMISTCLFALLAGGEKCNVAEEKSNYDSSDGFGLEEEKNELYGINYANPNSERDKMRTVRNNNYFYDITVRVREKTYKLHRICLESKSKYFRDIFEAEYAEANTHCDDVPSCPNKDKEYVLDNEIDPFGFDQVLDYIYFEQNVILFSKVKATLEIFKIADILEIEKLRRNCEVKLLQTCLYHFDLQNTTDILKFTYGKSTYEDLYLTYLYENIITKWPEIYNVSHFCSISWTMLRNMLKSSRFHLYDLDPDKILDIFSKWICHDAINRIHLLPQIARIINPYCEVDHNEFKSSSALGSTDFSLQFVRDKLYQTLSTLTYMAHSEKLPKKLEEIPVFIAPNSVHDQNKVILNADLDVIAYYNYYSDSESESFYWHRRGNPASLLAALINDSLFTISNFDQPPTFHVYNFVLQKYFSLQIYQLTRYLYFHDYFTLLSCNNEIYGGSRDGRVVKYSMQFNRWTVLMDDESSNWNFLYTSDGKMLYRMHKVPNSNSFSSYVVEDYNFETNLWSRVSGSPLLDNIPTPTQLSIVNNRDLAVTSFSDIVISNRESTSKNWNWRYYKIPQELWNCDDRSIFVQCEDRMMLLIDNKLYHYSHAIGNWTLEKELPLKDGYYIPYGGISVIHRPRILTNQ